MLLRHSGGRSRIRTHGCSHTSGFQDRRYKPDSAILPYSILFWCEWRDLNPQTRRRQILSLVRLPISPHSLLAEEVGLEPTRPEGPNGLANRPLNHLSILPIRGGLRNRTSSASILSRATPPYCWRLTSPM